MHSIENALGYCNLFIDKAELISTQGGSIRISAVKNKHVKKSSSYSKIIEYEKEIGINQMSYYKSISTSINEKVKLISLFLKRDS